MVRFEDVDMVGLDGGQPPWLTKPRLALETVYLQLKDGRAVVVPRIGMRQTRSVWSLNHTWALRYDYVDGRCNLHEFGARTVQRIPP